jgi:hypothetical protein
MYERAWINLEYAKQMMFPVEISRLITNLFCLQHTKLNNLVVLSFTSFMRTYKR